MALLQGSFPRYVPMFIGHKPKGIRETFACTQGFVISGREAVGTMPTRIGIPNVIAAEIKRLLENAHVSMMESIIDACAGNFFAAPMADEVEDFFTAHPLPGAQRKVAQVRCGLPGALRFCQDHHRGSYPYLWDCVVQCVHPLLRAISDGHAGD